MSKNPIWFDQEIDLSEKIKNKAPYPEPEIRNIAGFAGRYEAFLSRYIENTYKLFLHNTDLENK